MRLAKHCDVVPTLFGSFLIGDTISTQYVLNHKKVCTTFKMQAFRVHKQQ